MGRLHLWLGVPALAALGLVVYQATRPATAAPMTPPGPGTATEAPDEMRSPAVVTAGPPAPTPTASAAPEAPVARFTNGIEAPLLNGVKESVGLPWTREWSPIAETVVDREGIEWYRHEDGSWSTTIMRMDLAKGREVGIGLVYTAAEAPVPSKVRIQ